jgi:Tfp pilus assembly protein FimV
MRCQTPRWTRRQVRNEARHGETTLHMVKDTLFDVASRDRFQQEISVRQAEPGDYAAYG